MSLNSDRNFLRNESRPTLFRRSITCSLGGYDFPVLTVDLVFVDPASDSSRTVVAARALSEDVVSVSVSSSMSLRLPTGLVSRSGDSFEPPFGSHFLRSLDRCGAGCGVASFEGMGVILANTGSSDIPGVGAVIRGKFLLTTPCPVLRAFCVRDLDRF